MKLIDGKATSDQIKAEIAKEVQQLKSQNLRIPHLAAILVGDDPASQTYVANKDKACREVGFVSSIYRYPANITEQELIAAVDFLNNDDDIDGFIVQLPLPKHINEAKVTEIINPEKDVDGFRPENIGRMALGMNAYVPATPNGIVELIKHHNIETEGKHCVVLGRSHIVGMPISILMSQKFKHANATVTICHSKTKDLKYHILQADILIAAIGQPEFVKADMVKDGVVIIDVGIHRVPSASSKSGFKLVGDVDFENVSKKASYITPVPGGVGPMTIASLLINTLKAAKKEVYK